MEPEGTLFSSNRMNFSKSKLVACMPQFCFYPPRKCWKMQQYFKEKMDEQKGNRQLRKEVFTGKQMEIFKNALGSCCSVTSSLLCYPHHLCHLGSSHYISYTLGLYFSVKDILMASFSQQSGCQGAR